MPTEKDVNVTIKKIPEHFVLSTEVMDKIVRLLYVVAYPTYDIADYDQKLAQELLEAIDNG